MLAVIAYHAFPAVAPGGFVGVDVFFVISGFLITGIVLDDVASARFSIARFYARRVRRLFPALLVMLFGVLVMGLVVLLEHELVPLGIHVRSATLYLSNFTLFSESGYFDVGADLKPLQHLWSLAVEEQFYVVWPLLLLAIARAGTRGVLVAIGAVIAVSFAVNLLLVVEHPSAAFYLPFGRLWELALGALLAVITRRVVVPLPTLASHLLSICGAMSIALSIALVDAAGFPGLQALLPTVGAAALIAAGPRGVINQQVLARRSAVEIGKISYSLYLFHWPLLVFPKIVLGQDPPPLMRGVLMLGALALAAASTHVVETPLRESKRTRVVVGLVAAAIALGIVGQLVAGGVVRGRSDDASIAHVADAITDWSYLNGTEPFVYRGSTFRAHHATRGASATPEGAVVFVGDSFIEQYWPRVEHVHAQRATPRALDLAPADIAVDVRPVIFATRSACPPFVDVVFDDHRECAPTMADARALAAEPFVDTVVVGAVWTHYFAHPHAYEGVDGREMTRDAAFDEFERWLVSLTRDHGKRVVLVLTSPQGPPFDPRIMLRSHKLDAVPRSDIDAQVGPSATRLRQAAERAGATVIDPVEILCDSRACPVVDDSGEPLMTDGSHLRAGMVRSRMTFVDALITR